MDARAVFNGAVFVWAIFIIVIALKSAK